MRRRLACSLMIAGLSVIPPVSLPSAEAQELLREEFEGAPGGDLPSGWSSLAGSWRIERGELVGESRTQEAWLAFLGKDWKDIELAVTVKFLSAAKPASWLAVDVGCRTHPKVSCHALAVRQNASRPGGVSYGRRWIDEWSQRDVGKSRSPLEIDRAYRLRLRAGGGRVRFWIDGDLAIDSALARDLWAGGIGFRISAARVAFDDVVVSRLQAADAARLRVRYGPLRPVSVVAHRGASGDAPENTVVALRLGVERRADAVEFDVYRTLDKAIVVLHDKDLLRTTDFRAVFPERRDASVSRVALDDLRKLDAGNWKSPRFRGERIPTLAEALDALGGRAMPVVEIKPDNIGREVAEAVRRLGAAEQVFVQSFSSKAIREFREVLPQTPTGFLTGDKVSLDEVERARVHVRRAREAGANAVVCHYQCVGPRYLNEIHRRAMTVWVYTVDDPSLWDTLIRLGVDGLITNVPGRLVEYLERRKVLGPR